MNRRAASDSLTSKPPLLSRALLPSIVVTLFLTAVFELLS